MVGSPTQRNGWKAEDLAAEYLRDNGFGVVKVNKSKESGKAYDILAKQGNTCYVINVKSVAEYHYNFFVSFSNMVRLIEAGKSLAMTPAYLFIKQDGFFLFTFDGRNSDNHYSKPHITLEPVQINKSTVPDLLTELPQHPLRDGKCAEHGKVKQE